MMSSSNIFSLYFLEYAVDYLYFQYIEKSKKKNFPHEGKSNNKHPIA